METHKRWRGGWIWTTGRSATTDSELVYFRRVFDVPAGDSHRLVVDVSADSRYRLFLNGESVSVGPAKGVAAGYHYETVDVSAQLRPGRNVLAAKVLHLSAGAPFRKGRDGAASVWRSPTGGFLLDGAVRSAGGDELVSVHTADRWRYLIDGSRAVRPVEPSEFVGDPEIVDGTRLPHGWERTAYDDSEWPAATPISAAGDELHGEFAPWFLVPRTIPPLYEREREFVGRPYAGEPLTVAAGERHVVELDAGELTTGYLTVGVTGGAGSVLRILGAECYEPADGRAGKRWLRDKPDGHVLVGHPDTYVVAGFGRPDDPETYEPFDFRTFRYVRLEVEAGPEPVVLHRLSYRETGYPLDVIGEFACSDDAFNAMWDISVRTLRRCMHETYEDCPHYEQLQYTMDTRLQMLFTYQVSGDDRLARKAIHDFHSSLQPTGMLLGRAPSAYPLVIPGFALFWVLMLHDHHRHFGDVELVRRYRPTMDAVLDWFDRQLTEDGVVGASPAHYWSFVDWTPEWNPTRGIPTAAADGPISIYSMMYSVALQAAADLAEASGRPGVGEEYRNRAGRLNAAVRKVFWSAGERLFRDGVGDSEFSQHAQIWAVLAGVEQGPVAVDLLERALDADRRLVKASYVVLFFLFRALATVGRYERSFELWDRWRGFVELNVSTWPEGDFQPRSECHAWSAIPLAEFPCEILGVQPAEPGYRQIRIAPQIGQLSWARGKVATPRGLVTVDWRLVGRHGFEIEVDGPAGVSIELTMPDGAIHEITPPDRTVYRTAPGSRVGSTRR